MLELVIFNNYLEHILTKTMNKIIVLPHKENVQKENKRSFVWQMDKIPSGA